MCQAASMNAEPPCREARLLRSRRRLPLLAMVTALLTLFTAPATSAAVACDATWSVAKGPPPGALYRDLAVMRTGELWAVGTAIAHRVEGRWHVTRPPDGSALASVAARPGAVWAVGADAVGRALILRWTGKAWQAVSAAPAHSSLFQVSVSSSTNVWISGQVRSATGTHALALTFNGIYWRTFVLPGPGSALGVDTSRAGSTWLVGTSGPFTPASWHWNGASWQGENIPGVDPRLGLELRNVTMVDDTTVMAVGTTATYNCCDAFGVAVKRGAAGWHTAYAGWEMTDVSAGHNYGNAVAVGVSEPDIAPQAIVQALVAGKWVRQRIRGLAGAESSLIAVDGDDHGNRWAIGAADGEPLLIRQCRSGNAKNNE